MAEEQTPSVTSRTGDHIVHLAVRSIRWIIMTAITFMDENGLTALTMRRLGRLCAVCGSSRTS
jgi:hypothetical protein